VPHSCRKHIFKDRGRDRVVFRIEAAAPSYLRNVVRIITETGLRIYKELTPMKRDQVDLENRVVWIPDSKTPNGVAEVPLTQSRGQRVGGSSGTVNRVWDSSGTVFARKARTRTSELRETAVKSRISGVGA